MPNGGGLEESDFVVLHQSFAEKFSMDVESDDRDGF